MEKRPKGERHLHAVEVHVDDLVLQALRQQLKEKVIDMSVYEERKAAYLAQRYPDIPDIIA